MSNTFNVGYAYDFTTSNLNTVSRGTHEIVLGFLIGINTMALARDAIGSFELLAMSLWLVGRASFPGYCDSEVMLS